MRSSTHSEKKSRDENEGWDCLLKSIHWGKDFWVTVNTFSFMLLLRKNWMQSRGEKDLLVLRNRNEVERNQVTWLKMNDKPYWSQSACCQYNAEILSLCFQMRFTFCSQNRDRDLREITIQQGFFFPTRPWPTVHLQAEVGWNASIYVQNNMFSKAAAKAFEEALTKYLHWNTDDRWQIGDLLFMYMYIFS